MSLQARATPLQPHQWREMLRTAVPARASMAAADAASAHAATSAPHQHPCHSSDSPNRADAGWEQRPWQEVQDSAPSQPIARRLTRWCTGSRSPAQDSEAFWDSPTAPGLSTNGSLEHCSPFSPEQQADSAIATLQHQPAAQPLDQRLRHQPNEDLHGARRSSSAHAFDAGSRAALRNRPHADTQ